MGTVSGLCVLMLLLSAWKVTSVATVKMVHLRLRSYYPRNDECVQFITHNQQFIPGLVLGVFFYVILQRHHPTVCCERSEENHGTRGIIEWKYRE